MFSSDGVEQKILLVDDDPKQITLLHRALKEIGQVFFAQDGHTALEIAIKTKPDIILLDIMMPGIDGLQVLAKLKENIQTSHIPVVFITSYDSTDDQLLCLKAGAVDFIAKPLHPLVVAARVRAHLMLRARERELVQLLNHTKIALDAIGDAVITTDKNCRITFMNPAAELLIGIVFADAKDQLIESVMPLRVGIDGPPYANPIRVSIEENRIVGMAINCQMLKQDGQWIPIGNSSAPLLSEDEEVIGGVVVFNDLNEARALDIKMSHTLQYDQLTHLPNRFLFMERLNVHLSHSQKNQGKLGLILIDIDRFKLINEEFGFEFGDRLLKSVSEKIKSQLNDNEILSRHSADEFMVLVPELGDPKGLANLAVMINESVMQLTAQHSGIENFSISMGLSVYPDDAESIETILMHADTALRRAKTMPLNENYSFYSDEMETIFLSRRLRYKQIKTAIAEQGVVALYQPIVDANSGDLVAVEALMRLKDANGEYISPVDFIPLAEETRLIIPLGEQLIRYCLEQLKHWHKSGLFIKICLNISPIQFVDPGFVPFLLAQIERYGVSPEFIEVEITESLMLENPDKTIQDLMHLRGLGITVSIDDFGTGFSCLSYLKDLPIDVLKIDKSFVAQLDTEEPNEVLVKTISILAQSMGFKSIAEGVESKHQAKRLQELEVSLLQGYYFSRPTSAQNIKSSYKI